MHPTRIWFGGALAVLSILGAGGCTPSTAGTAPTSIHSVAGGCAGTVVTDSVPPAWSQDGFTHKSARWAVPWALGTDGGVVAYVFGRQLVAGTSPRVDGSNNKVGWAIKDHSSSMVVGRPVGMAQPVVSFPGGSSVVDVPTAGCWTFRVLWGAQNEHVSTVNLEVLPAGTLPAK